MFKLPVKNHWNVYGGYSSSYYVDMITMGYTGKEGDSFYVPMHFNTIVSLYQGYKLSILSIIFTITCKKPLKCIRWLFVLILCGYDNHWLHSQGWRFVLCPNALFFTIISLYKSYKLFISSNVQITCEKSLKCIRWLFLLILWGYDNHGLHRQGRRFVLCPNAL